MDDVREGEELKRLAAQYELEKKGLEQIRQQEAHQLMADNLKQIDDVHKMKKLNQMQEDVRKQWGFSGWWCSRDVVVRGCEILLIEDVLAESTWI